MKLVHWPLMGGLLRLVQRWGDWAGPSPDSDEGTGQGQLHPGPSSLYQMWQLTHQFPVYQSPYCCIMIHYSAVLMCPLNRSTGCDPVSVSGLQQLLAVLARYVVREGHRCLGCQSGGHTCFTLLLFAWRHSSRIQSVSVCVCECVWLQASKQMITVIYSNYFIINQF